MAHRDINSGMLYCHLGYMLSCILPKWRLQKIPEWTRPSHWNNDSIEADRHFTGSQVDGLALPLLESRDPENQHDATPKSDIDATIVIPVCSIGEDSDSDTHFVIDTSGSRPGYLRLVHRLVPGALPRDKICLESLSRYGKLVQHPATNHMAMFLSFESIRKEMFLPNYKTYDPNLIKTSQGPAENLTGPVYHPLSGTRSSEFNLDIAYSVRYSGWPQPAKEWRERFRPSGWPPAAVIDDIVEGGCHMVQVAHPLTIDKSTEWRFSFTVAETKLARSLSTTQRQCYQLLKLILVNELCPHTVLSSYCLKNTFFWKMEQIPEDIWLDETKCLGVCFIAVLDLLIHFLVEQNLPHYFIIGNNLIGSKPREAIRSTMKILINVRRQILDKIVAFDDRVTLSVSKQLPLSLSLPECMTRCPARLTPMEFLDHSTKSYIARLQAAALERSTIEFSGLLDEGSTTCPQLVGHVSNMSHALRSLGTSAFGIKSAIGYAWCLSVHCERNRSWRLMIPVARGFFELAMELAKGSPFEQQTVFLYAIYLQHIGEFDHSLDILLNAVIDCPMDPDVGQQNPYSFEESDLVLVDPQLRLEQQHYENVLYPAETMQYHLLIRGYHLSGKPAKAAAMTKPLDKLCNKMAESDSVHMKWMAMFSCGLLGRDLLMLGRPAEALAAFRKRNQLAQGVGVTDRLSAAHMDQDIRLAEQAVELLHCSVREAIESAS